MTLEEMSEVLDQVEFRDWDITLNRVYNDLSVHTYLQVQFDATCNVTGELQRQHGRKWLLSPHMTRSELVTTAIKAVLTAIEHEAREEFLYRGEMIFAPHFDVEDLVTLSQVGSADVRVPA